MSKPRYARNGRLPYMTSDSEQSEISKGGEDEDEDVVATCTAEEHAAVAAGLQFGQPTLEEAKFFNITDAPTLKSYIDIRNGILVKWCREVTKTLTLEACVDKSMDASAAAMVEKVFKFLQMRGYINCGIVPAEGMPVNDLVGEVKPKPVPQELLEFELYNLLQTVDMAVTTERQLRKMLEEKLGRDLSESKKAVRVFVEQFLSGTIAQAPKAPDEDSAAPAASVARDMLKEQVIVVGAGPSGLAAARHLQRVGLKVVVLEARTRVGGRVHTDSTSLSVPVDLGASIITGVEAAPKLVTVTGQGVPADPSATVCKQLGLDILHLKSDMPLYDAIDGGRVDAEVDQRVEQLRDALMDAARRPVDEALLLGVETLPCQSLGDALDTALMNHETLEGKSLGSLEKRVLGWHWAHLEYGCAAPLSKVSLAHWNQDEEYGGFGGPHCMIPGGYSQVMEALASGLDIHFRSPVTKVSYDRNFGVTVCTAAGEEVRGAAVVITLPLGCLKAGTCTFEPELPAWKRDAISRLGFGNLNKVVLEFKEAFWDVGVDFFGSVLESDPETRGMGYTFWNLSGLCQAPVLTALVSGHASNRCETMSDEELVAAVMAALRKCHSGIDVPPLPEKFVVTRWGSEEFTRGAYSYVAVGSSGEDYDLARATVDGRVFFAGEHTNKQHPDTVGGAMQTGHKAALGVMKLFAAGGVADDVFPDVDEAAKLYSLPILEDPAIRNDTMDNRRAGREVGAEKGDGADEELDEAAKLRAQVKEELRRRAQVREQMDQTELERSKAREEVKQVWRHLSQFSDRTGKISIFALHKLMLTSETDQVRMVLAQQLQKIPPEDLLKAVEGMDLLKLLNDWILVRAEGPTGVGLLSALLRVMSRIPLTNFRHVRTAGLHDTLKLHCSNHELTAIRALAEQVAKVWTQSTSLALKRKAFAAAESKSLSKRAAADASSMGQSPTNGTPVKAVMHTVNMDSLPPEGSGHEEIGEREALCQQEAMAREASAVAMRAAEAAAAAARTVAELPSVALPSLLSFGQHYKKEKHGDKPSPVRTKDSNKHSKHGSNSKKHAHRHRSKRDLLGRDASGSKDFHPSDGVSKEVAEFVKSSLLGPLVAAKKLNKEESKWVLRKSCNKVVASRACKEDTEGMNEPFLTKKRKGKIRDLVDKYVKQLIGEKRHVKS